MATASGWTGRLFMGHGRLLYAGPLAPTHAHAHHAFQVVLAVGCPFALEDGAGTSVTARAVVIPPDAPHAIAQGSDAVLLLHVDPDTLEGRGLKGLGIGPDAASWEACGTRLLPPPAPPLPRTWAEGERVAQAVVAALLPSAVRPRPVHPAVMRVLRLLPSRLDGDLSLSTLAQAAQLSPGRLSHLFSQEVGLTLRPYILWLRLQRAAVHLAQGASLTEAAHAAGFTDSAHLNHTFRRMFGLAPSEVAHAVEWVLPATQ